LNSSATPLNFNSLKSTGVLRPINAILPNARFKQLTPNSFKNHKPSTLIKTSSLSSLLLKRTNLQVTGYESVQKRRTIVSRKTG